MKTLFVLIISLLVCNVFAETLPAGSYNATSMVMGNSVTTIIAIPSPCEIFEVSKYPPLSDSESYSFISYQSTRLLFSNGKLYRLIGEKSNTGKAKTNGFTSQIPDIDAQATPLELAIESKNTEAVRNLIEQGASVDSSSLLLAIEYGLIDIVQILIDRGLSIGTVGCDSNVVPSTIVWRGKNGTASAYLPAGTWIWWDFKGVLSQDLNGPFSRMVQHPGGITVMGGDKRKVSSLPFRILNGPVGHTEEINVARFSPNNKIVLTQSSNETKLWKLDSCQVMGNIKTNASAYIACFTTDGSKIALCAESEVEIWDVARCSLISSISGYLLRSASGIVFSPDGNRLLIGCYEGAAQLFDIATNTPLKSFKDKKAAFRVNLSHDGRKAITSPGAKKAILWDVQTGKRLKTIRCGIKYGGIYDVFFLPDGVNVGVLFEKEFRDDQRFRWTVMTLSIYNGKSGKQQRTFTGSSILPFKNNTRILCREKYENNIIYDLETGGKLSSVTLPKENSTNKVQVSPDGSMILVVSGSAVQVYKVR
jgi:WD40 repeat protein